MPSLFTLSTIEFYSKPFPYIPQKFLTLQEMLNNNRPIDRNGWLEILFENDFKSIEPELFLLSITLCLLLYGVILSTSKEWKYPLLIVNIACLGLFTILLTSVLVIKAPLTYSSLFYDTLVIDPMSSFLKKLALGGAFFSIVISLDYMRKECINGFEIVVLTLLSLLSVLFLISSTDFISIYLAIEFQSLCFYIMAGSKRDSEFSTEAGLKYFLLGAFSSGLLLFGCSYIYGFTGITSFTELGKLFAPGVIDEGSLNGDLSLRGIKLGMIFILVGLLFKLTAVPFHMWAPDVYEGAPLFITAFFSITPKVAILAVFIRLFLTGFYDLMVDWQTVCHFSSIASMLLGAIGALSQNKIKRLLAYSSIGHVGYLLAGLCCGTVEGVQGLLIYLFIYLLMTINLFGVILFPLKRSNQENIYKVQRLKYTSDLSSLAKGNPVLCFTLAVSLFSIAGIPPLAGFYSKAFLFFAALSSNLYLIAVIGVVTSVISCFYYLRLVKIMYFENPLLRSKGYNKASWLTFSPIPKAASLVVGLSAFCILFFVVYPTPLYLATHKVALAFSL